jgi:hypothetical protein
MMTITAYGSVLYLSDDGGQSWRIPEFGRRIGRNNAAKQIYDMVYSPNFANDQTIFITGQNGLWRSTDAGVNWTQLYLDLLLQHGHLAQLCPGPDAVGRGGTVVYLSRMAARPGSFD